MQYNLTKSQLRDDIKARRAALTSKQQRDASRAVAEHAISTIPWETTDVIAGYWPSDANNELDIRLLLEMLEENGHTLCLPVTSEADAPLHFHKYTRGDALIPHRIMPILEPARTRPEVTPNVLLCPLLACDRHGFRLGYGGGYYDRTIKQLHSIIDVNKRLLLVGICYNFQIVEDIPKEIHDEPLDLIISERGVTICAD